MLEFKNASVALYDGRQSKPFSLVVDDGDMVCISGGAGSGKSLILHAILGLSPIWKGYITYDGEIISPGSASYFRQMIAYIPQDLPNEKISVKELFRNVAHLHVNANKNVDTKQLMEAWQLMGIDKMLFDKTLDKIDAYSLQLIMLSFFSLFQRKVLLIDNVIQTAEVYKILFQFASSGVEIIYTCRENKMTCNKIVNL